MAQGPKRLRGVSVLALGLVIGLFVAACSGSSATPSPVASAAAGGTPLDGVWLLTDYVSVDGTNYTVPSSVTPNIRFDGNAASGQAGCNTFNAVAIINGNELRFDTVQNSNKPCEDPMATVEAAFLQALNLSTTYTVTGNKLVITNPQGKPSLSFIKGT